MGSVLYWTTPSLPPGPYPLAMVKACFSGKTFDDALKQMKDTLGDCPKKEDALPSLAIPSKGPSLKQGKVADLSKGLSATKAGKKPKDLLSGSKVGGMDMGGV